MHILFIIHVHTSYTFNYFIHIIVTTVYTCYSVTVCYDTMYIDMLLLQSGSTALHYACLNGNTEVAEILLMNNANISATNNVSDKIT